MNLSDDVKNFLSEQYLDEISLKLFDNFVRLKKYKLVVHHNKIYLDQGKTIIKSEDIEDLIKMLINIQNGIFKSCDCDLESMCDTGCKNNRCNDCFGVNIGSEEIKSLAIRYLCEKNRLMEERLNRLEQKMNVFGKIMVVDVDDDKTF